MNHTGIRYIGSDHRQAPQLVKDGETDTIRVYHGDSIVCRLVQVEGGWQLAPLGMLRQAGAIGCMPEVGIILKRQMDVQPLPKVYRGLADRIWPTPADAGVSLSCARQGS